MGSVLVPDSIAQLARQSTTQVKLPASIVTVGGRQFNTGGDLLASVALTGLGGLDTGVVAANTLYWAYVVRSGTTLGLVISTSRVSPTGFTKYKRVGAFYSNSSSQIGGIFSSLKPAMTDWIEFPMVITGSGSNPTRASTADLDFARWRRVGDSMEIHYQYHQPNNTGAVAGTGVYLFGLPFGAADTAKVTPRTDGSVIVGYGNQGDNSADAPDYGSLIGLYDSSNLYFMSPISFVSYIKVAAENQSFTAAPALAFDFQAKVPIVGWSGSEE